jgi:AcrR family transcriptional regulator
MAKVARGARRKLPRLCPEGIAMAALNVIDRVGLESFSMHRLGLALKVEAMSLYHHYPSRGDLLDGVARLILDEISVAIPARTGELERDLRGLAQSYRSSILRHPRAFPILATRPVSRLGGGAFLDASASLLRAEGCADQMARRLSLLLASFLNGILLTEISELICESGPGFSLRAYLSDDAPDPAPVAGLAIPPRSSHLWVKDIPFAFEEGLETIVGRLTERLEHHAHRRPETLPSLGLRAPALVR